MHPEPIDIEAADGRRIAARCFAAQRFAAAEPRATVVIRGGTAIPQRFYRHFAIALAEAGYSTYTFDYRGIGHSRQPGPLRHETARYLDWAQRDAPAVAEHARQAAPDRPLVALCHSFGAQTLGLDPQPDRYAAGLLIAAGSADGAHWPLHQRLMLRVLWRLMPAIAGAVGYIPGWMGLGGSDLPGGAARDWARWARHPRFLHGVVEPDALHYDRWRAPVTMMSFADDAYAPPGAAAEVFAWYAHADDAHHDRVDGPVGHFGFFRPAAADVLWPRAIAHIERMLTAG